VTTFKRLIDTTDGADRFVLSLFELQPNGSTPPHYHDWEHEVFVLQGTLQLVLSAENRTVVLQPGDAVFIPRGEAHGFTTGPEGSCQFLVVAPTERPPVRNFFLSKEDYQYEPSSASTNDKR